MQPLKPEHQALKGIIGDAAFLRRDLKRRALFVSDVNRRLKGQALDALLLRLAAAGWHGFIQEGLLLLDLSFPGYQRIFHRMTSAQSGDLAHGLARIFARHETAFTADMLGEARLALLRYDAGEAESLIRQAARALAVSLRSKAPMPGFFIPLLEGLCQKEDPH